MIRTARSGQEGLGSELLSTDNTQRSSQVAIALASRRTCAGRAAVLEVRSSSRSEEEGRWH
jgi:hypothetical protein